MKKQILILIGIMMLVCTACDEENDSEIQMEQTELAGTMHQTMSVTEPETSPDDVPNLEPTRAWIDYGQYGSYRVDLPETEHIIILEHGSTIYKIDTMVGGIEQRFFESGMDYQETADMLGGLWMEFTGTELLEKDLVCYTSNPYSMNFRSFPKDQYAQIQSIEYHADDTTLIYHPGEETVTMTKNPEHELIAEYSQTQSLGHVPMENIYDPDEDSWILQKLPDDTHIYYEDSVILDGEEVTFSEIERTAKNYLHELYAYRYIDETRQGTNFYFLTGDYQIDLKSIRVEAYSDGNHGVFMTFGLASRDMPIISDEGTASGTDRQIRGTSVEIGMFHKDEIGYVRTNYLIREPDAIQLTDPRPKMEGTTLLSMEEAFSLADEALTESRTLETIQLVYGTEEIYNDTGNLQGRVLTPVWHFVFAPTEAELSAYHTHMILDIDAVTKQIFTWYSAETEQSGEKCWITNPHWWEKYD